MTSSLSRPAPGIVQDWIRSATPQQRAAYLSKGEAQCIELTVLRNGDFTATYRPGLRGVIVGAEAETPAAAIAVALQSRENLRAVENPEPVDEAALGIDQESLSLLADFLDVGCQVDKVFHLGTMLCNNVAPDDLIEALEGLNGVPNDPLFSDLPILEKSFPDGEFDSDVFYEAFIDHGFNGFIVEASVPLHVPTGEGCASIHGGQRHVILRYGATYEIAARRALNWGREEIERMMAAPIKKRA